MIRHIVMWKLKDFAEGKNKAENAGLIKQRLEGLKGKVSEVKKIEVGIDMESSKYSNFDVVMDTLFDTFQDLETYQVHPLHSAIAEWIGNVREARSAVDFEIG